MQIGLGFIILRTHVGLVFFEVARDAIAAILELSDLGAGFVFGETLLAHFAFKVLPTIIFVSSLSYLLFYWGLIQKLIQSISWLMRKTMGISASEGLVTAANIFCGQTEAPLFIKPYLHSMTPSEINTMMTGGMATVAGGVLAAYVSFGAEAGHLLAASLMSAPAAIVIAKIMVPESQAAVDTSAVKLHIPRDTNAFEAACSGAADGLRLSLNVGAMLIAFISLVGLANMGLGAVGSIFGASLTLEAILGYAFQPLAFLLGVSWDESFVIGRLLGEKIVMNEFLAYVHLGDAIKANELSERGRTIATYALCGFANFASIAIQIGGIGSLEPSRKSDFARFGFRSMIGGTLATLMTACIAGLFV